MKMLPLPVSVFVLLFLCFSPSYSLHLSHQHRQALMKIIAPDSGFGWTDADLIDPRIDVDSQRALRKMLVQGGETAVAANLLLTRIKTGTLEGIYQQDQEKSAKHTIRAGTNWWSVLPKGVTALCFNLPVNEIPIMITRKVKKLGEQQTRPNNPKNDPIDQRAQQPDQGQTPTIAELVVALTAASKDCRGNPVVPTVPGPTSATPAPVTPNPITPTPVTPTPVTPTPTPPPIDINKQNRAECKLKGMITCRRNIDTEFERCKAIARRRRNDCLPLGIGDFLPPIGLLQVQEEMMEELSEHGMDTEDANIMTQTEEEETLSKIHADSQVTNQAEEASSNAIVVANEISIVEMDAQTKFFLDFLDKIPVVGPLLKRVVVPLTGFIPFIGSTIHDILECDRRNDIALQDCFFNARRNFAQCERDVNTACDQQFPPSNDLPTQVINLQDGTVQNRLGMMSNLFKKAPKKQGGLPFTIPKGATLRKFTRDELKQIATLFAELNDILITKVLRGDAHE